MSSSANLQNNRSFPEISANFAINSNRSIEDYMHDLQHAEYPIYNWNLSEFFDPNVSFGLENFRNSSSNESNAIEYGTLITCLTALSLGTLILATVIGNVFVIAAILLERNLQSVANYLILSLAVADLLVAVLVMPLSAVYEVRKEWTFGSELCDIWTASDVLCCTASILHLVAIALDRFWAVTNLNYIHQRSPVRVCAMIAVIWCVSSLISAAPIMGWKDAGWRTRVDDDLMCMVSQDVYYQIFATMTSFYLPLGVILILYWRIYQAARKRIRRKRGEKAHSIPRPAVTISETTTFTRVSSTNGSPEKFGTPVLAAVNEEDSNDDTFKFKMAALPLNPLALLALRAPKRREQEARRERKAAKTLAVITGAFVVCWLPFFVVALIMPLCGDACPLSPFTIAACLWLGYCNSTLNPIIYTIFSPDFRHAFRSLIFGRKRTRRRMKGFNTFSATNNLNKT